MKTSKYFNLSLLLFIPIFSFAQDRIMVISGGGSRGAWGGGLAQTLVEDLGHDYKAVVGTSTGSLLAPFIALEEFQSLKEGYTTIRDKDIFNVRPFKVRGKKRGKLRSFKAFSRILLGKRTIGESKNLRKTIRRFYSEDLFNTLKSSGKSHIATVTNITTDNVEYKSSNNFTYDEMVDWMWASANQPVFMSLHKTTDIIDGKKFKQFFVDGGVKEAAPLAHGIEIACNNSVSHIDVIIHSTLDPRLDTQESGGAMKLLGRTIELFLTEVRQNDLAAAKGQFKVIESIEENCDDINRMDHVTITYYYMPEEHFKEVPSDLIFREDEMSRLWELGRKHINEKMEEEELSGLRIQVQIPRAQLCSGEIFDDN